MNSTKKKNKSNKNDKPCLPGLMFRNKRILGNINEVKSRHCFYTRSDSICLRAGDANFIFWGQE